MDDKVKYWESLSEYDLDTADAMLQTKRFLYVGFMCHQAVEKILKAYFTKLKSTVAPLYRRRQVFTNNSMKFKKK